MGFRDWHGWLKSGMIGALLGFVVVMSLLAFFGHFSSSPANPLRVYDIFIDILFFTIFSFLVGLLYNWVINFRKSNWLKGGIFFGILSLLSSLILLSITISI